MAKEESRCYISHIVWGEDAGEVGLKNRKKVPVETITEKPPVMDPYIDMLSVMKKADAVFVLPSRQRLESQR